MPSVILRAADFGAGGHESPAELEADTELRARIEAIRLEAGPRMHLGDVTAATVPKMVLVSPPRAGGTIATRSFIPHRCHRAIGVFGAVSVGCAALLPEGPAAEVAAATHGNPRTLAIEHPSGQFEVVAHLDAAGALTRADVLRTARKLANGVVFG